MSQSPIHVMIASPLDPDHVRAIESGLPPHVEVLYDPALLPPTRYIGDHTGEAEFRRSPEQERQWREMAAAADIAFDFPFPSRHPRTYAPNLRWVQTTSAGVGQLVLRLGIAPGDLVITTASGVHARPLTEFVFMVLLMAVKDYRQISTSQQAHHWERFCADELSGKTIAIIGPGRIGQEIARIARCFDMRPVALARTAIPERAAALGVDRIYARHELREMLGSADVVVLSAPHTPETENILDRTALDSLKPGVILVNIGRGQLVDEAALIEKLQDGTIRLAGLDVFATEPLPVDSPLWDLPNVIVNPHSASTSTHENGRIVEIFRHNLTCFLEGRVEAMRNVLDIARMY